MKTMGGEVDEGLRAADIIDAFAKRYREGLPVVYHAPYGNASGWTEYPDEVPDPGRYRLVPEEVDG